jgi:hypothetical protein
VNVVLRRFFLHQLRVLAGDQDGGVDEDLVEFVEIGGGRRGVVQGGPDAVDLFVDLQS